MNTDMCIMFVLFRSTDDRNIEHKQNEDCFHLFRKKDNSFNTNGIRELLIFSSSTIKIWKHNFPLRSFFTHIGFWKLKWKVSFQNKTQWSRNPIWKIQPLMYQWCVCVCVCGGGVCGGVCVCVKTFNIWLTISVLFQSYVIYHI